MKNILIPTDFSQTSQDTFESIVSFLHESQIPCRILLLNTYIVQETDPHLVIQLNDEMKEKSRQGLERSCQDIRKLTTNPNITIETASHMGSLSNVIYQLLKKMKIDLVAIGAGEDFGAVVQLLQKHKCPLLMINGRA
jgi:hypothetical protein